MTHPLRKPLSSGEIGRLLASHQLIPEPESPLEPAGEPRKAAVLLPLFNHAGRWNLLYIRRARNERDCHSGEVAFPGGAVESHDADVSATALREANEEIGLEMGSVKLLGRLPEYLTSSNYLVTPVVGEIGWPADLLADPVEVARIFSIPLDWLAEPGNHQVRPWQPPGRNCPRDVVFFDEFDGERLWGVSARITVNFLRILAQAE